MESKKACFTSNKTDWETPQYLFDELNAEFKFDKDVCASEFNSKCSHYIDIDIDCLSKDNWFLYGEDKCICFMNPPYGKYITPKFVKKAYEESLKGNTIVCLLPARTDTAWFHDYCMKGEIRFIRRRVKFVGAKTGASFPSMIVIFRGEL